ncbi:MAG: hypothetical protein AB7D92_00540 [Sphaerochaeta sp.]
MVIQVLFLVQKSDCRLDPFPWSMAMGAYSNQVIERFKRWGNQVRSREQVVLRKREIRLVSGKVLPE